ncbi:tail fiber domain-containing protein, partial [Nodularia spumigena]
NLNGYSFDKDIQIQSGVIRSDANLLLQTNGNVGIGVDIPEQKLHVDGVVRIGTNTSILDISTGENNLSHFKTNLNGYSFDKDIQIQSGVIRSDANLLLQTNGNVGIGVDIPDEKLQVDGVVRIGKTTSFLDISTGENNLAQFKTNLNGYSFDKDIQIQLGVINGNLRVNGRILQDSSRELKENITELSSQEVTEILRTIKPIKFNYKNSIDKETQAGFLSEDVPSLLTLSDNTAISPVDLVAVLTKAVKDQNIQISLLLNALGEQRIQIATLVEKVSVLESRNL